MLIIWRYRALMKGVYCAILVSKAHFSFGAFDEEQIAGLINHDLEVTISSQYKAQLLIKFCEMYRVTCKVHIKIDSGMNRVGVRSSSAPALIDYVLAHPCLDLCGVYSHLAASDEIDKQLTHIQIEQFGHVAQYVKSRKPDVICHLANSGALHILLRVILIWCVRAYLAMVIFLLIQLIRHHYKLLNLALA